MLFQALITNLIDMVITILLYRLKTLYLLLYKHNVLIQIILYFKRILSLECVTITDNYI